VLFIDTVNMALVSETTYWIAVTNFGDYSAFRVLPWTIPTAALSAVILEVFVRLFYAYRIYILSRGSPYLPAAISIISLTAFGIGIVLGVNGLENSAWESTSLKHIFIATLSCDLICDVLVTFGMVHTLLRNRTLVKRTNTVLNLLAIYAINCGVLNVVFAFFGIILRVKYQETLIYLCTTFIAIRLYFCSFMAVLNSRSNLREMLDGPGLVVATFTKLEAPPPRSTSVPCSVRVLTETSTDMVLSESLPPRQVSSYTSFLDNVMARDGDKFPVSDVPNVLAG